MRHVQDSGLQNSAVCRRLVFFRVGSGGRYPGFTSYEQKQSRSVETVWMKQQCYHFAPEMRRKQADNRTVRQTDITPLDQTVGIV